MTATVIDLRDRMAAANDRTRRTVNALANYRGLHTDAELADAMGMGRTKVNNYRTGTTKFSVEMVAAFAAALDVPDYVLGMLPDEALRWVLDHAPNGPDDPADQGITRRGCIADAEVVALRTVLPDAA